MSWLQLFVSFSKFCTFSGWYSVRAAIEDCGVSRPDVESKKQENPDVWWEFEEVSWRDVRHYV